MRPRLRTWIKRALLGLLGLIVAVVALVAIALQTDWGQRQVKAQVVKALAGTFAGDVEIADLDVGMLGSVELEGLRISYPNREDAIRVGRLSIECDIWPLLAGRVRCGTLRVVDPQFWHRPDAGALLRPSDEEPGADVKIATIKITGGRVEIPGETISEISADLSNLVVHKADVAVDIKELSGTVASQERSLTVSGAVALADNAVKLNGGVIATGDSRLAVELERLDLETLKLSGSVAGEISAADVPVAGWRTKIVPDLAVSGVAGERVAVSGTIGLDAGSIAIEQLTYGGRLAGKLSATGVDPSAIHEAAPPGLVNAESVEVDIAPRFELETLDGTASAVITGELQGEKLGKLTVTAAAGETLTAKIVADSERGRGVVEVVARPHERAILAIDRATATGELATVAALVPGLTARSVAVKASARGPLDKLAVKGSATLRGARYDQMSADLARAEVDLDAFDVRRAVDTVFAGRFTAHVEAPRYGDVAGATLDAGGSFARNARTITLTAGAAGFPMLERAELVVRLDRGDERIDATVVRLDAVTEGIRWRGNTGKLRVAGPVVTTLRDISIASPAAALTVAVTSRPRYLAVEAAVRRLDLRRSKALHGIDVGAVIDAAANVTLRGDTLTGDVTAKSAAIAIPGIPKIRAEVTARLERDRLSVTADGAPLEGKGTAHLAAVVKRPGDIYDVASWRRTTTGDLISLESDIADIDVRQIERFAGTKIEADGRGAVALRFPHEGKPALGIRVDAERGRYAGVSGLRANIRATWGARLETAASLHQAGDQFATTELALDAPLHAVWQRPGALLSRPLSGFVKVDSFSLRRLERLKLVRASLGGFVSATANVSGTALEPAVEIKDGRGIQVELAGVRARKVFFSGTYRGDRVDGRVAGTMRQGGSFEINADFKIPRRALQLEVGARKLELAALRAFAPAPDHPLADIDGTLDITKVVVNVDPSNMRASGRVRLSNGVVLLEGGARAITQINASLVLRGNKIRLASLNAKNGSGTIRASGEARFAGYTPEAIEIDAEADDIPFVAGSYLASIDLESEITGSYRDGVLALEAPVRRGRVDLTDTGVELQSIGDLEDVVFVDELKREGKRGPREPPERGLKTVIAIDLSRGVRVVSAEVDALVVGQMEAAFVGAEMVSLTGQVRARSGKVKLFERDYKLIRAIATFDGPLPINPDLDIEINRTFPQATVTVQIAGRLDQVLSASSGSKHIQLSSDADFSEVQIIALMLGQSPDDVSQQTTIGQKVGGIGLAIAAGEVRDILRSVGLKVDVVRLHEDGWEVGKWVRFRLGDLFSRRVLLGYRFRDAGDQLENTNEGTLELPVTRSVNLEGRVGDRGIGSFDLLWIKRF